MFRFFFIAIFFFTSFNLSYCQDNRDSFLLTDIKIQGNKWTKKIVITRELNFFPGKKMPLQWFYDFREENEERLKNLGTFNDVELSFEILDTLSKTLLCHIKVVENWYIYPGITFELADRNFSEWWYNQNRDLSRTNYGVRLDHINVTGRRDRLIAQWQSGFRKKYELVYNLPYLTKDGNWGAEAFGFFANQDQLPYITQNNRTIYGGFDKNEVLRRLRIGMAVFYRPNIYHRHSFRLEFHKNTVNQFVIESLNPNYFLEGRNSIKFFYFNYQYTIDKRIAQFYPIGGYVIYADFKKEGFGIFNEYNNTSVSLIWEYYKSLSERVIFGTKIKGKTNLDRRVVSFANNTALGWGDDLLGGYYRYVIDGTDYVYAKNNLRYKIYRNKFKADWFPFRQFRVIDVQLHTRLFFDVGYVNERTYSELNNNTFSNRLLYGGGPAVDLILFNNYIASFNVGMNHQGELDYFFQYRTNF